MSRIDGAPLVMLKYVTRGVVYAPTRGSWPGAPKILHKIAKIRVSGNSGLLQPNALSAAAYECALLLLVL